MAYLDKIKVNNTNVDVHDSRIPNEPVTSVNGEMGDVTLTIPENKIFYGTCATAAGTAAKVVVCDNFTSSDLTEGTIILVKFSATNSGAVGSLTLNVNSTGAKKIQYINNGTLGNLTNAGYIKASTTYMFVFDGTYWLFLHNYDSNTKYTAMTQANANAGTETTARTITAAVLKNAIKTHAQVHDVTVDGVSVMNGTTAEITLPTPNTETIVAVSQYDEDRHYITKENADKLKELHTVVKFIYDNHRNGIFLFYGYPDGDFVYKGLTAGGTMSENIRYVKNTDTFTILGLSYTYDPNTTYYISEVSDN